jgi:hypothetical protein
MLNIEIEHFKHCDWNIIGRLNKPGAYILQQQYVLVLVHEQSPTLENDILFYKHMKEMSKINY